MMRGLLRLSAGRRLSGGRSAFAALALATMTTAARAEDAPLGSEDRARAQQLFESALADVEAGRFGDACPKFAASHHADPKTSTLLNLGNCYESLGRIASAWAAFREAEGLARKVRRPDLEASARSLAESLAPKLVRLTIVVPEPARAPDLVVSRDGRTLTAAEWGVGIPVDSGEHDIAAEAPGRTPWRARVIIGNESQTIEVPRLAIAPSSDPVTAQSGPSDVRSSSGPRPSWWTTMRTTGVAIAGAGTAGLVVGLVLGLAAKSSYDDARARCTAADDCPSNAVRDGESARSLANGATVIMVSGAVLASAGAALIVISPPPPSSSPRDAARSPSLRAGIALGPGTFGISGAW